MTAPAAASPWREWLGRAQSREDGIAAAPVQALLATLDDTETRLGPGDALPPLWHWLYFLPLAPHSQLGPDGHPRRGGFLPPVELPRRMFASGSTEFLAPLRIGRPARRDSEVVDIAEKRGRSGPLVFVEISHRIEQDGQLCLQENQTLVYREAGEPAAAPQRLTGWPRLPVQSWSRIVTADPVLLFRFSALTFNGHRIHYDRPYAMQEEGYPGLVVHGPLQAVLLMELVRRHAGRPVRRFAFRALAPVYDTAPFRLVGLPTADRDLALQVQRCDGELSMQALAEFG